MPNTSIIMPQNAETLSQEPTPGERALFGMVVSSLAWVAVTAHGGQAQLALVLVWSLGALLLLKDALRR